MANKRSRAGSMDEGQAAPERAVNVSAGEIARRAYELFEARGGRDGQDLDDWLRAEAELRVPPQAPQRANERRRSNRRSSAKS
jgi:Protein of unknown function (DUF2934)